MRKQGKLKLQRHRTKVQKQKVPQQPQVEYSSESEASADEWADMLDEEEQQYIMKRLAKQPHLLSNVPQEEKQETCKKRKRQSKGRIPKPQNISDSGAESDQSDNSAGSGSDSLNSEVEDKFERELAERPAKKMRPLLPIKTKQGLEERAEECEDTESEQELEDKSKAKSRDESLIDSDSGMEGTEEETLEGEGVLEGEGGQEVTAVQLMAARRDRLAHEKLRIGALCSSLLESPEKKLKNLFPILYLMEERLKDGTLNLHSVRKLATLSACEVFKDILPEYMIRHQDYSDVKLKKDTLALYKYEKELLEFYKRYLQRLEKAAAVLRHKKGDTRKIDESSQKLGLLSLQCMCEVLTARPQFNFARNIAQSVVPFLDSRYQPAREAVTSCCMRVFAEDTRGELTLAVVRLINQLVKRRGERLHPKALDCLLSLKLYDVDLDADAELRHKKAQDQKHKKRIVNLSKKEKKRAKKLKEVERELQETEAQENSLARKKLLTETTRAVFHVYFRLLKTAPRAQLLDAALTGIAKFTHVINLEYYSDLVAILARLLEDDSVRSESRLHVARTALSVLAGTGDALNVDPARFHAYIYAHALEAHAGATNDQARIIIEAASQIISRARRVSPAVLQAFAKRLALLAVHLPHNGALACLQLIQLAAQQSKAVSSMFEPDPDLGSGRYDPHLPSPEHCNAQAAGLRELATLSSHYHPTVRAAALACIEQRCLPEFAKLTPLQILEQYDGSQMAFKPPIPPPKRVQSKSKPSPQHWTQQSLQQYCETIANNVSSIIK